MLLIGSQAVYRQKSLHRELGHCWCVYDDGTGPFTEAPEICSWRPKEVFHAKTQSFLNHTQVFFVPKPKQDRKIEPRQV